LEKFFLFPDINENDSQRLHLGQLRIASCDKGIIKQRKANSNEKVKEGKDIFL